MPETEEIRKLVRATEETLKIQDEIVDKAQQIIVKRLSIETGISKEELNTFFAENTEPLLIHRNVGRMISELLESI